MFVRIPSNPNVCNSRRVFLVGVEQARSGGRVCLYGVVGAVDGLFVRTETSAATERLNTNEHYSD